MKRAGMILLLSMILALTLAGPTAAKTTFISIGTGGTGGIYYPYGGGVAEIWSKYVPGIKAVAEVTGASVENVKLAHKGETVIGEVMGDVAVAGYNGLSKFKGKKHNVLSMAIMYPNLLQVVALKKSGITNIEQAKGKNVSTGSPGSGTNFMTEVVLKALGIPLDSYKDSRLSFTENANALRDGTIAIGSWSVGRVPAPSWTWHHPRYQYPRVYARTDTEDPGGQQDLCGGGTGRRCIPRRGPARAHHRRVERDDLPEVPENGPGLQTGQSAVRAQ